jgi:hypothetical protein
MIAKTYALYCVLTELDATTCRLAMESAPESSPAFCTAVGQFRAALQLEQKRIGSVVEAMVAANLRDKGRVRA